MDWEGTSGQEELLNELEWKEWCRNCEVDGMEFMEQTGKGLGRETAK